MPPTLASTLSDHLRPGLLALRHYWKPFLLIEICGLVLVMLYFKNAAVRGWADAIAGFKAANGLWFIATAGVVSCALLPELGKIVALGDVRFPRKRWNDIAFHSCLFGSIAVISDAFYTLLARTLGDTATPGVIAGKILIDQFIYSPILTLPLIAFVFTLRSTRWSLPRAVRQLGLRWYERLVLPLLLPCWCFWFPMTALMYSLPASLQFCFAMFASAAWCLLMVFIAQHEHTQAAHGENDHAELATAASEWVGEPTNIER